MHIVMEYARGGTLAYMAPEQFQGNAYRSAREFWDVIALALTTSARTFAFGDGFEKVAGETWPFDGSEQPLVYGHASRPGPLTPSRPLPVELAASVEEGPDSELGSVREKQKAPPDGDSGLSLPAYSIPASPNPRHQFAPDPRQPRSIRFQASQTGRYDTDKAGGDCRRPG